MNRTTKVKPEPLEPWGAIVAVGPKSDPVKRARRQAKVRLGVVTLIAEGHPSGLSRRERRRRFHTGGATVLHNTRTSPVDGGPRPDVLHRRIRRALRSS